MTREVRYLMFSKEELYHALSTAWRVQGKQLPKGFLKDIRIGTTAKPEIALRYISNAGAETLIEFEDQDVMAALLAYCKQSNIPMSAKATKSLEIKDGMVGMFCTLNFKISTITNENDKLSYSDQQTNSMKEKAKAATAAHGAARAVKPSTPQAAAAAKPSPAAMPAAANSTADNSAATHRKVTELD